MRIVVALGGNALLRRGERPDEALQRHHVHAAGRALAELARDHSLVLCHGNGPQIGLLALQSANDVSLTLPYPLDDLGAQTQGMIGYWLVQELFNRGLARTPISLLTQVVVHELDPAFADPAKFIGLGYSRADATTMADTRGWSMRQDGTSWRRVVPSPAPQEIVELDLIRRLVDNDHTVVCAGGGGIPVLRTPAGQLRGLEAVIDKDATAALLAIALDADRLLILTDVPAIQRGFGTPQATSLSVLGLDEIDGLDLPDGSMGPKVAACARFVTATGRFAAIGPLERANKVLHGHEGTAIVDRNHPRNRTC